VTAFEASPRIFHPLEEFSSMASSASQLSYYCQPATFGAFILKFYYSLIIDSIKQQFLAAIGALSLDLSLQTYLSHHRARKSGVQESMPRQTLLLHITYLVEVDFHFISYLLVGLIWHEAPIYVLFYCTRMLLSKISCS
jgi:hypothetical protein